MILYSILAFVAALTILLLLLKTRLARVALDHPNHRSLHTQLTPRTGGIGVIVSVILVWLLAGVTTPWIVPVAFLLGISLLDDMNGLSVKWRLMAQLVTSAVTIWILLPDFSWPLQVLAVLGVTWMINLYNFMDGSDGLAGGMAVLGFGSYAISAWMGEFAQLAIMNSIIVAASLAFLVFNFNPARIFLGDSGSVPLGFLAGIIGLYGWQTSVWPLWFPLLVFSPFIMDASVILIKRTLMRERVWEAHRDHYYQRLIRMGWSHRRTAFAEYALMILVGGSAIALEDESLLVVMMGLVGWFIVYLFIMWRVDKQWMMHQTIKAQ